jgi:hypothetical protein
MNELKVSHSIDDSSRYNTVYKISIWGDDDHLALDINAHKDNFDPTISVYVDVNGDLVVSVGGYKNLPEEDYDVDHALKYNRETRQWEAK